MTSYLWVGVGIFLCRYCRGKRCRSEGIRWLDSVGRGIAKNVDLEGRKNCRIEDKVKEWGRRKGHSGCGMGPVGEDEGWSREGSGLISMISHTSRKRYLFREDS